MLECGFHAMLTKTFTSCRLFAMGHSPQFGCQVRLLVVRYMKADMICVRFVTDFKEKEGDFKVQFSQDN